jgi:hypothetical protein
MFLFICSLGVQISHPYITEYPYESRNTLRFYEQNRDKFDNSAKDVPVNGLFLFSIVAPEVSQYNFLRNKIETSSLKVLYVEGGTVYSDFSIGQFQMKPSFVETMEQNLLKYPDLKTAYSDCLFADPESRESRVSRVNRLNDTDWQLRYLSLFVELMKKRFASKVFANDEEKLKFYAAAYNVGFYKSAEEIEKIGKLKLFPHFGTTKYRYCEIALCFYRLAKEE